MALYGNKNAYSEERVDIFICTIEKANNLINRMMEEKRLDEIAIVVFDEMHMLGDGERGFLLEMMVTKLLHIGKKEIQIVGLSATLANPEVMKHWIKGQLHVAHYRPVALEEYVVDTKKPKIEMQLVDRTKADGKTNFSLKVVKDVEIKKYADQLINILIYCCTEITDQNKSVLVFCSAKEACNSNSKKYAQALEQYHAERQPLDDVQQQREADLIKKRQDLVSELRKSEVFLPSELQFSIMHGVAYHHADLTTEQRQLIEQGFRNGTLNVLFATSTLAAGVNLPARRVILTSARMGPQFINTSQYRQMCGRAGRAGIDDKGDSILFYEGPNSLNNLSGVLSGELTKIESKLSGKGLKRLLLEIIASDTAHDVNDISSFIQSTLWAAEKKQQNNAPTNATTTITSFEVKLQKEIQDGLSDLSTRDFLVKRNSCYYAQKLGLATVAAGLDPDQAEWLFVIFLIFCLGTT